MGISVTGVERVLRASGKARSKFAKNIADTLKKGAEIILKESQKYVPVDTGALKLTGRVETRGVGLNAESHVIYDTAYAIFVHENVFMRHDPPTRSKFLTYAVNKMRGTVTAMLKRNLRVGTV